MAGSAASSDDGRGGGGLNRPLTPPPPPPPLPPSPAFAEARARFSEPMLVRDGAGWAGVPRGIRAAAAAFLAARRAGAEAAATASSSSSSFHHHLSSSASPRDAALTAARRRDRAAALAACATAYSRGARLADGCPSGHGLSGTLQLAASGYVALVCFFVGGLVVARLLYGQGRGR